MIIVLILGTAIHELKTDLEYWIKDTTEIVTLADEQNDVVTADIFTGYLNEYQKLLWMVKAYEK